MCGLLLEPHRGYVPRGLHLILGSYVLGPERVCFELNCHCLACGAVFILSNSLQVTSLPCCSFQLLTSCQYLVLESSRLFTDRTSLSNTIHQPVLSLPTHSQLNSQFLFIIFILVCAASSSSEASGTILFSVKTNVY